MTLRVGFDNLGLVFRIASDVKLLLRKVQTLWGPASLIFNAEAEELRFQATGRQHRGCITPQAVTHSLVLLKMGKIIARNMLI